MSLTRPRLRQNARAYEKLWGSGALAWVASRVRGVAVIGLLWWLTCLGSGLRRLVGHELIGVARRLLGHDREAGRGQKGADFRAAVRPVQNPLLHPPGV